MLWCDVCYCQTEGSSEEVRGTAYYLIYFLLFFDFFRRHKFSFFSFFSTAVLAPLFSSYVLREEGSCFFLALFSYFSFASFISM